MFRLLSYPLTKNAPVWPGNPPAAQTEPFESIAAGGMANTTVLNLFSHSGTHLDAPKHFNDDGPPAAALPGPQQLPSPATRPTTPTTNRTAHLR